MGTTPILEEYRKDVLKAAKELMYDEEVIHKVENARSFSEITRIMKTARESEDNNVKNTASSKESW